jgi:hypothetical protein
MEAVSPPALNSLTTSFLQAQQQPQTTSEEVSFNSFMLPQVSEAEESENVKTVDENIDELDNAIVDQPCGSPKQKNSARRNPWGSLSYADLITQAIKSAPDQRLTLAQIYEWLVKNVHYFMDKGDSASSSGWKVRKSIEILYKKN